MAGAKKSAIVFVINSPNKRYGGQHLLHKIDISVVFLEYTVNIQHIVTMIMYFLLYLPAKLLKT